MASPTVNSQRLARFACLSLANGQPPGDFFIRQRQRLCRGRYFGCWLPSAFAHYNNRGLQFLLLAEKIVLCAVATSRGAIHPQSQTQLPSLGGCSNTT